MTTKELSELFKKYNDGTLSEAEEKLLDEWYAKEILDSSDQLTDEDTALLSGRLRASLPLAEPEKTRRLWPRIAAAASLLIGISIAVYFALHQEPKQQVAQAKHDVAPFSKLAVLKTGHGKTIVLDKTHQGTLAQYANTHIQKTTGDQIAYTNSDLAESKVIFDTLQVPAGGKPYHLKLADGSAIIVNVASTLRYPENFRKNNNEVELINGEAYFAIVHNTKAPLTIKAAGQSIEDIGTEFNVNTYNDEPEHRTTLVEGAIKVNSKTLIPGQQAIILDHTITIAKANIEQITAWKNGYFRFNGEKIEAVMRELARWYNIEVKYEGKPSSEGYYLKVSRSKNISEVLKALERTNSVHFKIEGRRVTVLSKK
jgi:transmembrane sensor